MDTPYDALPGVRHCIIFVRMANESNVGSAGSAIYDSKLFEGLLNRFAKPSDRILEIGSGRGEFLLQCRALGRSLAVGVDTTEADVELSQDNGCTTFHYNGEKLPFPDQHFHLIVSRHSFATSDPFSFMKEITRCIRDEGHFLMIVPTEGRPILGDQAPKRTYTINAVRTLFDGMGYDTIYTNYVFGERYSIPMGSDRLQKIFNLIPFLPGKDIIGVGQKRVRT